MSSSDRPRRVLILDPFHGGSHRQLTEFVANDVLKDQGAEVTVLTLPAKKWHWRSRTAALHLSRMMEPEEGGEFDSLMCTSVLNLAELVALRPSLLKTRKVLFFHENQLCYPRRETKERDFQFGYNQITSALAADVVVFNSNYNRDSFLEGIDRHLRLQPDLKSVPGLKEEVAKKSTVVHFPVRPPPAPSPPPPPPDSDDGPLHLLWPHRWEHDKDPEAFFQALSELAREGVEFRVSVLGEQFSSVPPCFSSALSELEPLGRVARWGFLEDKGEYWEALREADVVVSTANHEFFGVSVAESVLCGCLPLLPKRLAYPELYPEECLYQGEKQLLPRLRRLCRDPAAARRRARELEEEISGPLLDTARKATEAFRELLLLEL